MNDRILARTVCERMFAHECSVIHKLISVSSTPSRVLERHLSDLNCRWTSLQEKHFAYVAEFVSDPVEIAANDSLFTQYSDEYIRVESACVNSISSLSATNQTSFASFAASNSIKLERVKFRTFDGDVRKYPKFKSEFKTFVEPLCSAEQLAFVLKSYLCDSVRREVENCDHDVIKMWKRLDDKYGTVQRQVDCIMYDFKNLPVCHDNASTLKMIHLVETAASDLNCINAAHELENHMIISYIEESMTKPMLKEWAEHMLHDEDRKSGDTKFKKLIDFLQHCRWIIEYNDADIRKTRPSTTSNSSDTADTRKSFASATSNSRDGKCMIHINSGHQLWHCRVFKSMKASERFEIVKLNNACTLCLETGHSSSVCNKRFRCTVSQCGAAHNTLLHDHFTNT